MVQYYYHTKDMENRLAGEGLSSAIGKWVEGEKIIFGEIHMPAGTHADPHNHPNEQIIIVIQGQSEFDIEGDIKVVGKGDIIRIPPNEVHSSRVVGDEEFRFVQAKDTSWGIAGIAAEKK